MEGNMTSIIPLDIISCTVVELLQRDFALALDSYGEQHCITTPIFLSNGNNVIPPQFAKMTIQVLLASNFKLSMLLSQRGDTMIPMFYSCTRKKCIRYQPPQHVPPGLPIGPIPTIGQCQPILCAPPTPNGSIPPIGTPRIPAMLLDAPPLPRAQSICICDCAWSCNQSII
jgi:hypothetical protein